MYTVLVTGANGFVGQAVCRRLIRDGWFVRGSVRSLDDSCGLPEGVVPVVTGDIGLDTDWSFALTGIDAVVHLAARVHVMRDSEPDPLSVYRRVNTAGTARLATMAAQGGVQRFLFLSSIKVNGEATDRVPFTELVDSPPNDPYALSKWEAEEALRRIAKGTGLAVVIIRSPLVYGPGVRANLLLLLRAVDRGMPFPLGGVHNQRSLIYLENLVDAMVACLTHPRAIGETYVVSDNEDLSTPELIRRLATTMARRVWMFPLPNALLMLLATLIKRKAETQRLLGSLVVDCTKIMNHLEWRPPYTVEEGLRYTIQWYVRQKAL